MSKIRTTVPTRIGPCYPRCAPTYGPGGSGARSHRLVSGLVPGPGAVLNGLLNNLIIYSPGNEVAGNALDLHTNALHLTDNNTVTSNPGHVYPLARQYTRANFEYHTRPGDDALLSTGDVDFTLAAWVYLDSKPAPNNMFIQAKWDTDPQNEYATQWVGPTDLFRFVVSDNGTAAQPVDATSFGAPALGTWYLVVSWHDSVANTINIQINNGAIDSAAHLTGVHDSTARYFLGNYQDVPTQYWDGRIGPSMMWKSAAGGGGVLTAAQRTQLYNAGAGLTYAEFTT